MKRILVALVFLSLLPFITSALADEKGKEESKYYEEQEREAQKRYEEQEREAQKKYEEQERESRKRYEEQERERAKREEEYRRDKGKHKGEDQHEYRYYPSSDVYYDEEKKVYIYLEGEKWSVSVGLPGEIVLDIDDFVTIEADSERPYDDHQNHQEKYGKHR